VRHPIVNDFVADSSRRVHVVATDARRAQRARDERRDVRRRLVASA